MRRAGGAAPGVRAERGARPRDAQLRRAREGEGGRGLLAALLGLRLWLAGQTLPVREVGGGGGGGGGAGGTGATGGVGAFCLVSLAKGGF